jgi:plasmid stability protein
MANLTIAIDDEVLRKARIRALEQGTSVNALLRDYLVTFVADDHIHAIVNGIVEHVESCRGGSGAEGRTWTREDLHER